MAQSSKGIKVYYNYGTISGSTFTPAASWHQIHDVTSIPAMQGDPSMLDATPLEEEDSKLYTTGLKDNGGNMQYSVLLTPDMLTDTGAAVSDYATHVKGDTVHNYKMVFAVEFPAPLNRYFWYVGEPMAVLPGEAAVDAVLASTFSTSMESVPIPVSGDISDYEALFKSFSVTISGTKYMGEITQPSGSNNGAIAISVPSGSTLTNLKPVFTTSRDAVVKVGSTTQTSGTTQQTFVSGTAINYTVTSEDGRTTKTYAVTITAAE